MKSPSGIVGGSAIVVLYTALMASGDAITKRIAGTYDAPQLFAISAFVVVALSCTSSLLRDRGAGANGRFGLKTTMPWTMALRALFTVLASIGFFYAFRNLPLADVFFFMALMPIFAAFLSGPLLGEPVRAMGWIALVVGAVGVVFIIHEGPGSLEVGHLWALFAGVTGTLSMLLSRRISQAERNDMAQVFYPNLALFVVMACALPFVWKPVPMADLGWILAYAILLFIGRALIVVGLRLLPAFIALPLLNVQFIWMVLLGALVFDEIPSSGVVLGVAMVVVSGIMLVLDEHLPQRSNQTV
ncbi:DMT family transporter [Pseudoprimorskyibacter insulae]|uniref:EamA domain-containing protein n=1 Tax=Pseudoprimorskyibacter insulae TaxID=1695997 RepID=A0A2R8AWQ2_9RHOB|nr:DMT family transporter [Pseudoprimorskyibacter insulae]SPF80309.1 hypothetical protein PRI8871_02112 [Pseudoprimorskyibacter insulae]